METIPALQQALGNMFQPNVFLAVFAATIASIIVGVLPAVTGALLVIMVLPFTFGADPIVAMPVMCALLASSGMGGSITAVLTGIPGDNANAPTVLDGFAMTRKGQAGRALGLALTVSVASCYLGVLFSIPIIPLLVPILMKFKTVEMLLIIIMAMLFLSVLTKGSRVKGLISAGIGLTLSCVGLHVASGIERLTFGNLYLYNGIEVSTVLMGVLAVPTLLELHAEGVAIAPADAVSAGKLTALLQGAKELFSRHLFVWLRGTLIGYRGRHCPGARFDRGGMGRLRSSQTVGKETGGVRQWRSRRHRCAGIRPGGLCDGRSHDHAGLRDPGQLDYGRHHGGVHDDGHSTRSHPRDRAYRPCFSNDPDHGPGRHDCSGDLLLGRSDDGQDHAGFPPYAFRCSHAHHCSGRLCRA